MDIFGQMPSPPPMYQMATDSFGNPVSTMTYAPPQQYYQQPYPQQPVMAMQQPQMNVAPSLGANFSGLIGTGVSLPIETAVSMPGEKPKRKRRKKTADSDSSESTEAIEIVEEQTPQQANIQKIEEMSYADTYQNTNAMLLGVIAQADELASDVKRELDRVRTGNVKGKYTYIANLAGSINGLLSNKLTAIREINSSIKAINDAEYKRYKDIRATDNSDDAKYIMDMYNAYVQTPVGSIPGINYQQPTTLDLTAGLNGVMRVDSVPASARDAGFQSYMANLTPEQNMMINEGNPNIEEVIVYDQATGKKYFDWVDITTGQHIPNMPATDASFMEDFSIDPRTRTAKNINLHRTMKVLYANEGVMNEY